MPDPGPGVAAPGHQSWLHRVAAHHKIIAALLVVLAVVAVPRGTWWPYLVALAVLLVAAAVARLAMARIARRMLIETPFVLFALAIPFFAHGPTVSVAGIEVSEPGLLAAGAMLAKATIGLLAGVLLTLSTPPTELISGLRRLGMPSLLVEIASSMLRYLSVIAEDMRRMRIARESRSFSGGGIAHARAAAASAGALFIRSYERGERVHLAMLSRGYAGEMPKLDRSQPSASAAGLWAGVLIVAGSVAAAWLGR